ncbi:MAG: hypothetical protein OHK0022_45060 [Roseiflexaceae bacterium]
MAWFWRIFQAPGEEDLSLPADGSSWHLGRQVKMLDGHWNTIIQFASSIDQEKAEQLDMLAQSRDDSEPALDIEKVRSLLPFTETVLYGLRQLGSNAIEPGEDDPDSFEANVYVDILNAVKSVFEESIRLNEPFQAWLEYT